ncbi:MAG: peptidylprolyl isomerase [Candidatus Micrarchaeota archaeon]|nr:peptidylprolyl isomerase [Candidatus Micrarchaeota archaeon]
MAADQQKAAHETTKHDHKAHETQKKAKFEIKPLYILAAIIVIGVIYLAISSTSAKAAGVSAPVVATGDNISVEYTGTFTNGTVFDTNAGNGKPPLTFKVGGGQLIQGFDMGVIGMSLNETKNITIPPEQAYGPVDPSLIIPVPLSAFGNQSSSIKLGDQISTIISGIQRRGVVTSLNATVATVNFNAPLAGQTLIFKIKVLSIQKG